VCQIKKLRSNFCSGANTLSDVQLVCQIKKLRSNLCSGTNTLSCRMSKAGFALGHNWTGGQANQTDALANQPRPHPSGWPTISLE